MGDAAQRAARLTDPVGHGLGMIGMIGGALLGAAVGAIMILTLPVSAPLLVGALVGVAAAGAFAGGALAGDQFMHGLQTALALPDPTTGMIGIVGSPNVRIGYLPAARAKLDAAPVCNGLFSLNHLPIPMYGPPARIAEGSSTVFINGMPAARVSSKLECGGEIKDGCSTVIIGGPTIRLLPVHDLEAELQQFFGTMLKVSLFAAGVITLFMGGEAILMFGVMLGGFYVANEALGSLGDMIGPGWRDMLQGGFGLATVAAGAKLGPEDPAALDERCACGEPVDAATGEVFTQTLDFELPGALPIRMERGYASSLNQQSWLGPNWCCSWGQSVEDAGDGAVHYLPGNGRRIRFELGDSDPLGWIRSPKANKLRLRQTPRGFQVRDAQNRLLSFAEQRGEQWLLTGIDDLNGRAIRFHYDRGALSTVEHSGGYRLHVSATQNRMTSIALEQPDQSLATLVRYEYDSQGRLRGVDNGSGRMMQYEYDDAARMIRWQDREGTWYQYRYDANGRCVESVGPDGLYHYYYSYDTASRTTVAVDSYGAATSFRYNERNQVIARNVPMGGAFLTEWDERGNKLSVTDPEGRKVAYQYDPDGNLVASTDALGRTIQMEYNPLGLPVLLTDAAGKRWVRSYDPRGNLIEAGREGEPPWRYERDAHGNLIRLVDPHASQREFGYNNAGLPVWVTDWEGNTTRYLRDAFGRVAREVDPLDDEISFAYNRLNKLAQVTLPTGGQIRWDYDAEGNLTRRTGPDGSAYSYTYGPFDLRTSVVRPSGTVLRFHHDLEGRLASVENEKGELWKYTYDLGGRVVEEQDFTGRVERFGYDRSGLCIRRTNGRGEVVEFERNQGGQITRRKLADGSEVRFAYDSNGLMSEATNPWITVKFERDEYGRVLREIQGDRVIESSYDERGLRTRRRTSEGQETTWRYDANGRVERLALPQDEFLEFTRDAVGRDRERSFGKGQEKPGGLVLRQDYDPLDRLVSQWAGLGGAPSAVTAIAERQYRYDLNGNPEEILDTRWGASRYRYDDDGRIASLDRQDGYSEEFQHDASGNISGVLTNAVWLGRERIKVGIPTWEDRKLGPGGRLEQIGHTRYSYDQAGRVIEKREQRPGAAERLWQYEWTSEGQLRSVVNPQGEVWWYEYDAFGRRTKKTGPDSSTTYVWDGDVLAEEIRESRASRSSSSWIFEPNSFRPVAKLENGKAYACVLDQVGTPRELISSAGELAWSAQLSAWGELESQSAGETECAIRFQGQWYDEESGLHYNRFRYYDPGTGSYLCPDPIGLTGGTRSYGYVHNPLGWIDPLGLAGCDQIRWSQSDKAWVDADGNIVDHPTSLISPQRTQHILYGDSTGGGHMSGADITNPAAAGKSQFPASWSEADVAHGISAVATDPASTTVQQTGPAGSLYTNSGNPSRFATTGTYNGQNIKVITEPAGEGIVTGHPVP